ncbi:MAG: magnesium/cobalt transporter CorA [bacterium]|nr:magnesium/cobalt transporter CorA [bacterium]
MRVWNVTETGCKLQTEPDWQALIQDKEHVYWIDLKTTAPETIRVLTNEFRFHPLAIEDTLHELQRPKVEEYEEYLFSILNGIALADEELTFREIDVFVGINYIVTIHDEETDPLVDAAIRRIDQGIHSRLPLSTGYLLYVLVDTMVDSYFPVTDKIGDQIESISEAILEQPRRTHLAALFKLKRALGEMWRVTGQQRDMFILLTHDSSPFIDHEVLRYYLRDVYDHLLRVTESVNTFRDNLSNVIDLYLSSVSNRLNIVVKRLTVFTILFGAFAVITGFYGMNFEQTVPPFSSEWGVPFVICVMAVVGLVIVRWLGRDE